MAQAFCTSIFTAPHSAQRFDGEFTPIAQQNSSAYCFVARKPTTIRIGWDIYFRSTADTFGIEYASTHIRVSYPLFAHVCMHVPPNAYTNIVHWQLAGGCASGYSILVGYAGTDVKLQQTQFTGQVFGPRNIRPRNPPQTGAAHKTRAVPYFSERSKVQVKCKRLPSYATPNGTYVWHIQ